MGRVAHEDSFRTAASLASRVFPLLQTSERSRLLQRGRVESLAGLRERARFGAGMEETESPLSPTQLELQNQALRDQIDGLNREIELVRRANARRKQAALSDGSELRRIDRALQKFKKDNASAREMLESVRARSAARSDGPGPASAPPTASAPPRPCPVRSNRARSRWCSSCRTWRPS